MGGLSWGKMEERASNREEEAEFVVPCIDPVTSFHAFFMLSWLNHAHKFHTPCFWHFAVSDWTCCYLVLLAPLHCYWQLPAFSQQCSSHGSATFSGGSCGCRSLHHSVVRGLSHNNSITHSFHPHSQGAKLPSPSCSPFLPCFALSLCRRPPSPSLHDVAQNFHPLHL